MSSIKIKQSETIVIDRQLISFAPYNPRKKDKKVVDQLKKNFKKVGFLGGIQWNKTTGNLIGGHKRLEALDLVYGYDGTKEKSYDIKVECIELDEKTEKEQNIWLNNKNVQGQNDFEALSLMINDIDIEAAGLEKFDINTIEAIVPNFTFGENEALKEGMKELKTRMSDGSMKKLKEKIRDSLDMSKRATHITITFKTYEEKAEYLEMLGINGDTKIVTSETFFNKLESI